jgi:putative hydrolase of the HAD superfamily
MIKNVIFDVAMVLINWHPELGCMFDEETAQIVEQAMFESGLWSSMDFGIEDDAAVFEKMIARAPDYREQILYVTEHLEKIAEQFDYTKKWISELKEQGYRVYFLSNYPRHMRRTNPELTDFTPMMDGGFFSYEVHLAKPDRKFFELLCEKYSLVPGECLFVDDRQENVEAAIACGMQAVRFDGYEQSYGTVMRALEDGK